MTVQGWFTLAALLIAAVALRFSYVQHREFLKDRRARARFRVTLRTARADEDGVLRTDGNVCGARVAVGIKNDGDRAAGDTVINALVPDHLENVRWCGPNGEEKPDGDVTAAAEEGDKLVDGEREFEAKYLAKTLSRVGTKSHYSAHFQFYVNVPDPGHGEARVPVRVTVQADELPDEVEEYVEELMVRVARKPI